MSPIIYGTGDNVEVKGSNSWFPATVLRSNKKSDDELTIEYTTNDDGGDYPVFSVSVSIVRPSPPMKRQEFRIGQFVEVFQDSKGWRRGKLVGFLEESRCAVVIRGEEKAINVACKDLRPLLDWIDGTWISYHLSTAKLVKRKLDDPEITIRKKKRSRIVPLQTKFRLGSKVEVRSDEIEYEGARLTATVVASLGQRRFRVEYHTVKTDDMQQNFQEVVNEENIRPYPPKTREKGRYRMGEAVDVWDDEGWWEGVILKAIDEFAYIVCFATTNEEWICHRSRLRLHLDLIDRKWVIPKPVSMLH